MAATTFTLLTDAVEGTTGHIENINDETTGSVSTIQTYSTTITGGPTAAIVNIEGSLDGTNWGNLATHNLSAGELVTGVAIFHVVNRPVPFLRAIVGTLSEGSNPTMSVIGKVQ